MSGFNTKTFKKANCWEDEVIQDGPYEGYLVCHHCKKPVHHCISIPFGTYEYCEDCYNELNLGEWDQKIESSCQIDYVSGYDDYELFIEQCKTSNSFKDKKYRELK